MSSQPAPKARSAKCRHFCFSFDSHNYCPTCREAGKGDDPCTNNRSCQICTDLSPEQHDKIKNRRRYVRKQKPDANTSKDDSDLLGDGEESFMGSNADLEGAADNLFSSPPLTQPLRFEALSLRIPHHPPPPQGQHFNRKLRIDWKSPWVVP